LKRGLLERLNTGGVICAEGWGYLTAAEFVPEVRWIIRRPCKSFIRTFSSNSNIWNPEDKAPTSGSLLLRGAEAYTRGCRSHGPQTAGQPVFGKNGQAFHLRRR